MVEGSKDAKKIIHTYMEGQFFTLKGFVWIYVMAVDMKWDKMNWGLPSITHNHTNLYSSQVYGLKDTM